MLLRNVLKGLRRKPGWMIVSVILLTSAVFLWLLSSSLVDMSTASIPEKHLTIAVPNGLSNTENVYDAIEHIRTSVSLVTDMDNRVHLKAYTFDGIPYIPSIAPELVSHANICILTLKMNNLQSSDQWNGSVRTRYVHDYDLEVVQIHELHEIYANVEIGTDIYMQLRTPTKEEDWAEQGKTYLVWGRLQQIERDGRLIYQLVPSGIGQSKTVEQNGEHLVYVQKTGEAIPTVSELPDSLDDFLKTDMGKSWQDLIFPIANILYSSVDVIGTDIPDSIRAFNLEETTVVDGTVLTEKQCKRGERVCLVSEQLAQINGWAVGDSIPLSMYGGASRPTVYHTVSGFFFEADYRIVGIYRNAEEYTGGARGVHPNTVFVPLRSIENMNTKGTDVSLVMEAGNENLFETEMLKLGYAGLFSYYSGPETEDAITRIAIEEARERWIEQATLLARYIRWSGVLLIVVTVFGVMRGCRTEIGYCYRIETAERILFSHILLRVLLTGLLSCALSVIMAFWQLPTVASRILHALAEPVFVNSLTEALPVLPFAWRALMLCMGVILLCGIVFAAIGTKRSYHYSYREGSEL